MKKDFEALIKEVHEKAEESLNEAIERLNECGITVHNYKENCKLCGYELDTYTGAGVNQILFIDFRDTGMNPKNVKHFIELFNERVNNIDIEDELKMLIEDKHYIQEIGLITGLQDLKDWKVNLQSIFTGKNAQQRQFEQVTDKFKTLLQQMKDELNLMPTKGNSINDCQKTNILHHLNKLEMCINGIELEDFIPNEYSNEYSEGSRNV